MKRIRCKFCHAKPRVQFAVSYAGHEMCQDCRWEYQTIFEGKVSKEFESKKGRPIAKELQEFLDDWPRRILEKEKMLKRMLKGPIDDI